jgi:hypothetical protein
MCQCCLPTLVDSARSGDRSCKVPLPRKLALHTTHCACISATSPVSWNRTILHHARIGNSSSLLVGSIPNTMGLVWSTSLDREKDPHLTRDPLLVIVNSNGGSEG